MSRRLRIIHRRRLGELDDPDSKVSRAQGARDQYGKFRKMTGRKRPRPKPAPKVAAKPKRARKRKR